MNARIPCLIVLVATAALGCGDAEYKTSDKSVAYGPSGATSAPAAKRSSDLARPSADFARGKSDGTRHYVADKSVTPPAPGGVEVIEVSGGGGGEPAKSAPPATPRKIIYNADVDLVAEDFAKVTQSVSALVGKFGGYVADTDTSGSTGSHRRANWKIRVPIEAFDGFLEAVSKLGELQRKQIHSQDVTEEFYDLSARIKNKKVEEARLIKHLEESTGKLKEILEVEKEISRVREEVERMEGRVRLLANLTDLTTVTVTVDERLGFVPTTAPTFGIKASRTLENAVKSVRDFLEGLALWLLSILPWLPFWIVGLFVGLLLLRWVRRRLIPALARIPWRAPIG